MTPTAPPAAYLFPLTTDRSKPIRQETVAEWLHKAEKLAGLERIEGSCWHAYRRLWAMKRKHLPAPDVAAAGGWSNTVTLQTVYQDADAAGMLRVVIEPTELKQAN